MRRRGQWSKYKYCVVFAKYTKLQTLILQASVLVFRIVLPYN